MSSRNSQLLSGSLDPSRKILVVGDWVLDEHWVIGVHRSPTSSRTGDAHYRALHFANATVESLCGAGRTASVLHQVKCGQKRFCEILGIGLWHEEDTGALLAMLDPAWNKGQTPHRVTRIGTHKSTEERLFNLSTLLSKQAPDGRPSYSCGTTRMIRIYQHTGSKFELLQRIDWELELPNSLTPSSWPNNPKCDEDDPVLIADPKFLNDSRLEAFIKKHRNKIGAVVIKDMRKGVVSEALIGWLSTMLRNVPWFISTKAWRPKWFDKLENVNVRLIVIPQMATQWAVRSGILNRWITQSGDASSGALYNMDEVGRQFPGAIIIALPDGLSVLARNRLHSGDEDARVGLVQTRVGPSPLAMGMPMASVFFPAMIAHMLRNENIKLDQLLKGALNFTHRWMSIEVKRVEDPEEWEPSPKQALELEPARSQDRLSDDKKFDSDWREFNWKRATDDWGKAFSDYGIIEVAASEDGAKGARPKAGEVVAKTKGKKYLELWRAMTEVHGYVCCVTEKRKLLQRVVNELGASGGRGRRDHKSCMFIASPGSGKTYLVRRLADALRLRYLGFNITQMLSKTDLFDCFDTVVTSQAQNREEPLLVFIDEINAKLDGQHVYDAFLAPLEEGVYVRAGKTFHIDPCVWVFAGTEHPSPTTELHWDKSDKASDFESRLTLGPLDLRIKDPSKDEAEARIEKVYLGVSLLRSAFPDVRKVSKKVLQAFHTLPPNLEARELQHFVKSFFDIQYGAVKSKNIPKERFKQLCGNIKNWSDQPEEEIDMIEIRA